MLKRLVGFGVKFGLGLAAVMTLTTFLAWLAAQVFETLFNMLPFEARSEESLKHIQKQLETYHRDYTLGECPKFYYDVALLLCRFYGLDVTAVQLVESSV